MAIDRQAMTVAAALNLSPTVASRLEGAWKLRAPSPHDTDEDAGRAIAIALLDRPLAQVAPQIDALTLRSVDLLSTGPAIPLSAGDALRHPLLSDISFATFTDAVGECFRSGRVLLNLAPSMPLFVRFEVAEAEGELVCGTVDLAVPTTEGNVHVRLNYGTSQRPACCKTFQADGDAIYSVGAALRGYDGPEPAPEKPEAPAPQSPAVH
jgi:hypothetical protein